MPESTSAGPQSIRFNDIDRNYLIPETDDPDGPYFPMSLVIGMTLTKPLSAPDVVEGLKRVNAKYPQFRLGYTLDYRRDRWLKLGAGALDQHWTTLVNEHQREADVATLLSEQLPKNINPLSQPLSIDIYKNTVIFKVHHSFADGRFVMLMLPYILLAALDESAFDALPTLSLGYSLPVWRVVWQTPRQGLEILVNWFKTLSAQVEEFKGPANKPNLPRAEPVKSGTPMSVSCQIINQDVMELLDKLRKDIPGPTKISLNTLVQIIIAQRLIELGLEDTTPTLTVPLDLKRYLKQSQKLYPGNLASQIRIPLPLGEMPDFAEACRTLQLQIDDRIQRKFALVGMPGEWLLALGGRKLYRKVNRDWLIGSNSTDPRFFIISNLGKLDQELGPLMPFIDPNAPIGFGIPLMGAPPLVIALLVVEGKGHLTMTYNPSVLSQPQIEDILRALGPEWLNNHATGGISGSTQAIA